MIIKKHIMKEEKNMKKINCKKGILLAGVLALLLNGCGKTGQTTVKAASPEVIDIEVKEQVVMREPDESTYQKHVVENENPDLVEATIEALKKYFDISADISAYEVEDIYFKDDGQYAVDLYAPGTYELIFTKGSIGADGFPTEETEAKLMPQYFATFSEDKELTGLYLSHMGWEKLEVPLKMEEAKKVAKEFLAAAELTEDGRTETMGATIISDRRIVVTFENGPDGAISVAVDIKAGKVEHFELMSRERAEMICKPKAEGSGLG